MSEGLKFLVAMPRKLQLSSFLSKIHLLFMCLLLLGNNKLIQHVAALSDHHHHLILGLSIVYYLLNGIISLVHFSATF